MEEKKGAVDVCGFSWLDLVCGCWLVCLSFGLFGSVGCGGKSDKTRPRVFGHSRPRVFGHSFLLIIGLFSIGKQLFLYLCEPVFQNICVGQIDKS